MSFDMDMSEFHAIFFEEAGEHLASLESLLLELDRDNPDPEHLNAIFRAAHSIKGSSSTFGFPDMAAVTHDLETLLDRVRKQEMPLTDHIIDITLAARDVLLAQLAHHQGGEPVAAEVVEQLITEIRRHGGCAGRGCARHGGRRRTRRGGFRVVSGGCRGRCGCRSGGVCRSRQRDRRTGACPGQARQRGEDAQGIHGQ